MKITHRIPPQAHFVSDPVTPEYQAQVERSMARAVRRIRDAEVRLASAERRLAKAERIRSAVTRGKAVRVGAELVELRREELRELHRLVCQAPASASHRGIGHGKKPIPGMEVL